MDSRGALAERNNPDGLVSVAGREIAATRFPLCDFGADAADAPSHCALRRSEEQHCAAVSSACAWLGVRLHRYDDIKHEKLFDNSYETHSSLTGESYGGKAAEVLIKTQGKSFRHEKTKKKRGTYRGGQISMASNSIKFED